MIAGGGFAIMAWRLAQIRVFSMSCPNLLAPKPRAWAVAPGFPATAEYYRILDRALAGWCSTWREPYEVVRL